MAGGRVVEGPKRAWSGLGRVEVERVLGGEGPGLRRCAPDFCSFLPGRGGVRPGPRRSTEEKGDRRQQLASHHPKNNPPAAAGRLGRKPCHPTECWSSSACYRAITNLFEESLAVSCWF